MKVLRGLLIFSYLFFFSILVYSNDFILLPSMERLDLNKRQKEIQYLSIEANLFYQDMLYFPAALDFIYDDIADIYVGSFDTFLFMSPLANTKLKSYNYHSKNKLIQNTSTKIQLLLHKWGPGVALGFGMESVEIAESIRLGSDLILGYLIDHYLFGWSVYADETFGRFSMIEGVQVGSWRDYFTVDSDYVTLPEYFIAVFFGMSYQLIPERLALSLEGSSNIKDLHQLFFSITIPTETFHFTIGFCNRIIDKAFTFQYQLTAKLYIGKKKAIKNSLSIDERQLTFHIKN